MSEYPQPEGFVKAMFAGQIHGERLLTFPGLQPEEAVTIEKLLADFQEFAAQKVNPGQIDREDHIPGEVKDKMEEGTKPLRRYMQRAARSTRGKVELARHKLSHLGEPKCPPPGGCPSAETIPVRRPLPRRCRAPAP